jgi:ferredoxin
MKVTVDTARCVGHARCAAVAPEVYELNSDGFNVTAEKEIGPELLQKAIRGMRACPERVISIEGQSD